MRGKNEVLFAFVAALGILTLTSSVSAQGPGHGRGGQGPLPDSGHCPMCGRAWDGTNYSTPTIPDSLPAPDGTAWINRLDGVMARERLSRAQYENDRSTYRIPMPYNMVIPQEDDHIEWLGQLYAAYGMQAPDSVPPVQETSSARDALQLGMQLEEELIPEYEWLIANSANDETQQLLEDILYQTRMHRTMFQHALSMGGMMGRRGRRWPGGYGNGAQMTWGHMNWGWGGGIIMMVVWTLLIVAAVYWFFRVTNKNAEVTTPQDSAVDILRKRYARGEISQEEFEERRRHLAP